jgi:predicted transglutaminase-like cysteine proteinase
MPRANQSFHQSGATMPSRRLPYRAIAIVMAVLLGTAMNSRSGLAAYGAAATVPSLFGSREVESNKLFYFPKCRGTLSRHFDETKLPDAPCTETAFNRCHLRQWNDFLRGLNGTDKMSQVKAVNTFFNRRPYIIDPKNYGVPDYWATPVQFLTRDGDCEDYAISKYFSLRSLGFSVDSMRIVVLQDLNLNTAHAILVVYMGEQAFVLDNQVATVVDATNIFHYRPIYSINEKHWWLHRL